MSDFDSVEHYRLEKEWGVNNMRGILYGLVFSSCIWVAIIGVVTFIGSIQE